MVATRHRIVLHRLTATGVAKMLVLTLLVALAAEPVAAVELASNTTAQSIPSRIALGGSAQVYALVTVSDGSTAKGSVDFYACTPAETGSGRCLAGTWFAARTLDAGGAALSPTITPSLAGTWCFLVAYSGTATVAPSRSTSACLLVEGHATTTVVAAHATEIVLGATTTATVTVTGTGGMPTGTVRFSACPADLSTSLFCTAPFTSVGTSALDATGAAASPAFTPSATGDWCFRAEYLGDATNMPSSAYGACFQVTAPAADEPVEEPATPAPGRRGPGAWHHETEWPVDGLTLAGTAYTNDEARALLTAPARGDAGNILVRHLIAAMLDRAAGATGPEADAGIADADALLAALGGPGGGTKMSKGTGAEVGRMIALIGG